MDITVIQVPIDQIKPYEKNAKKHPESQIDQIAKQIEAHGFDVPIVVDPSYVIIKGHGRLLALKQLGRELAPVIVRDDLTKAQVKAARLADNKIAESGWDMDIVGIEIDELMAEDFDVSLTGFDLNFQDDFVPNLPEDEAPEKEPKYTLTITFDSFIEQETAFLDLKDKYPRIKVSNG